MKSKLCVGERLSPNYTKNRTSKIKYIVIHHMAGIMTAEACCNIFMKPERKASANYCIGKDGEIWCSVPEEFRAWTTDNASVDHAGITIEVSNSSLGPSWLVSDKVYQSLIALCVDICQRYNITPVFTGKKESSTLQAHRWYQATLCPGPYLYDKFPRIALDITQRLGMSQPPMSAPVETPSTFLVKVNCEVLNVRKGPSTTYPINTTVKRGEVYTITEKIGEWGRLKSGAGFINLNYTVQC